MTTNFANFLAEVDFKNSNQKICLSFVQKLEQNICVQLYAVRHGYTSIFDIVMFGIIHDISNITEIRNPNSVFNIDSFEFYLDIENIYKLKFSTKNINFEINSKNVGLNIQKYSSI